MVMSTRNARKKLSPRSSAQKGNSGFSVCLRIVLFFQPPFFFADAYIELLHNSVVCLCGLHGFPPRRVIQSHVRLQSTANILSFAFSAASVNWVVGMASLNSGKCPAVDTAFAFRLASNFTHLRRALTVCPSERSRFAADANLARALGMPNLSGAKDRAKCYDVNSWVSLDKLASLSSDIRRPVVTRRLNKTWVCSPFAHPFLRFQSIPAIAILALGLLFPE